MGSKFKVGDEVVANHPTKYIITKSGWRGKVTNTHIPSQFGDYIEVSGPSTERDQIAHYSVESKYFDLAKESQFDKLYKRLKCS